MSRRVVVTGIGVLTPVGNSVDEMWQNLLAGKSGIDKITLFDVSTYPTKIAGEIKNFNPEEVLEKKEIKRTPRFIQYALKTAKEAITQSGLNLDAIDKERVAVLVGSGIGGLNVIEEQQTVLLQKGVSRISPFLIPNCFKTPEKSLISLYNW